MVIRQLPFPLFTRNLDGVTIDNTSIVFQSISIVKYSTTKKKWEAMSGAGQRRKKRAVHWRVSWFVSFNVLANILASEWEKRPVHRQPAAANFDKGHCNVCDHHAAQLSSAFWSCKSYIFFFSLFPYLFYVPHSASSVFIKSWQNAWLVYAFCVRLWWISFNWFQRNFERNANEENGGVNTRVWNVVVTTAVTIVAIFCCCCSKLRICCKLMEHERKPTKFFLEYILPTYNCWRP